MGEIKDSLDLSKVTQLLQAALRDVEGAKNLQELDQVRINYLGKKGQLTELLKELGSLSEDIRPMFGKEVNIAKQKLQEQIKIKHENLQLKLLKEKLQLEAVDITLPGRGQQIGSLHPVTRVRYRVEELFRSMGFEIVEGPEIEDDYHNFEALNMPADHPARAMHDTFYLENGLVLRTHTSPVQIRVMEKRSPPFRIITPGRVYRYESDQTHTPMFHQVEGLVVSENATFANLKALLQDFFMNFFERPIRLRFRPSFFPFTEPSAEVDIEHLGSWLEVLGCGMVHPKVLEKVGIDNEKYTGFAFGIGMDRLAMLRYGISDLRLMFENDLRFLSQF